MKVLGVTLRVEDLDDSVEFYRDVFGFPVEQDAGRAVVHAGSSRLTLTPAQSDEQSPT